MSKLNPEAVTLVIPARNASNTIGPCLDAVLPLHQRGELAEIIVVDDASTDDTAEIARSYRVRIVEGAGGGAGAARNLGWRAADTHLVWFIDSDCVAQPQALLLLLSHLENDTVAGAGGSYANMCGDSVLACLIHEEIVQRHLAMAVEVNFLATFNVVYRRCVLADVNGFDESLKVAEDADLAFRVRRAGYQLRFEMQSQVGHFHPTVLTRYLWRQSRHGYERVLLYRRHPGRMRGDSYSSFFDYIQPPMAMVVLTSFLLLFYPLLAVIPVVLAFMLLLLQLPLAFQLVMRLKKFRYLLFVPLSFIRAFYRGLGMTWGVLRSLFAASKTRPTLDRK